MPESKQLTIKKKQVAAKKESAASRNPKCVSLAIEEFTRAAADPSVGSLKLEVDKRSGVIKLAARSNDNQVLIKEILGPGLELASRYDGRSIQRSERDVNIRTLLDRGLTQMEVAAKLGLSQALVSRVKNSG